MQISQLYIYPVKSLAGIAIEKAKVTDRGLEFDRRWVLVDENNYQITQREMPVLLAFVPEILAHGISITNTKNQESILVPFKPLTEGEVQITVWDDVFAAIEVSPNISEWFSKSLGKEVRLMFQQDASKRVIDARYAIKGNEIVSTADGYPITIISEESLADLNSRLEEPVEMLRFRPNIVIKRIDAFEEDKLGHIKIGEAEIIGVKNCGRCIMITNKLDGSLRDNEPLKTLAQYRLEGNNVLFGRNFLISKEGNIEIGMEVLPL
jgi:uncharacterized protein